MALGQNTVRKMGLPLNHPSLNYWTPFISLDGNALLFQCDDTENRVPGLFFSTKVGVDWKDPIILPKSINSPLAYLDGATLSADGKEIWVPAQRSGGLGGYDLIAFLVKTDGFSEGKNPGLPLNSKEHEASAAFSPDGGTIYFMRCTSMNTVQADGCRLLTAKRKLNGTWETPTELPPIINRGNSQSPRLLADNETLIFLSDKHQPHIGGLDFYMSRWDGVQWSEPVALGFLNSERNERPVSITSIGRSVLTALQGVKKYELADVIFPAELKPKPVLRINGSTASGVDPATLYISVYDSASGKQLRSIRPDATGNFSVFLPYGNAYRLFADPADDRLPFFSKRYDLTSGQGQVIEKLSVDPGVLGSGFKYDLGVIQFLENTAPTPASLPILNRMVRLMQSNPQMTFQLICNADTYDLIFRHLRKKGVTNELEILIPETVSGTVILVVK
ncbi:MAG: hypothetical protein ACO263_00390 [Cyclobacteriaceae bacterium]